MPPVRSGSWSTTLSRTLLVLAIPLFVVVAWTGLVSWPTTVVRGLVSAASGRDVVQVADAKLTGITLLLLIGGLAALGWLAGFRLPERITFPLMLYGWFLWLPVVAALGLGVEYGLQAILSVRGYDYCTFRVTDTGKGWDGTYVYVRHSVPEGCAAVRTIFPPNQLVPGEPDAFDLPKHQPGRTG